MHSVGSEIHTARFVPSVERNGDYMKRTYLIVCTILLVSACKPLYGQELPFSEVVELKNFEDLYNLEKRTQIYIKENGSYKSEDRVVSVNIASKEFCLYQGTEYKDYFCNILVSIVISTADGKMTKEFQSYLNYETAKQRLFWDRAGYPRADRAGERFGPGNPLIVKDQYLEVELSFMQLMPSEYDCGNCMTDAESYINFIDLIRFNLLISYTPSQKNLIEQMQEDTGDIQDAQQHIAKAQEYFQQGEFEKAREEFEKAKNLFDQVGDAERSDDMQEQIDKCVSYDLATEDFEEGERTFKDAGEINDYQEAMGKYEDAKVYFQKAKVEFDRLEDKNNSKGCDDWIERCNDEIDDLRGVGSLREKLIYIIVATGVLAAAGIVVKQLGKGKRPKTPAEERMILKVLNAETGEEVTIQVEKTDKIGKVRQSAAAKLGIIPSVLLYHGEVCFPDQTAEECGLRNGVTVEIIPVKERGQETRIYDEAGKSEKLEKLEQRYREGRVSKELYETLRRKLESE